MTPIEHYWPPEMLATVFPDRFGHLAGRSEGACAVAGAAAPRHAKPACTYTVEPTESGCDVIRPRFSAKRDGE